MGREVAESCVDGVVMQMVAAYCGGFYAAKPELAARRIEAIGFQVGHQLTERYHAHPHKPQTILSPSPSLSLSFFLGSDGSAASPPSPILPATPTHTDESLSLVLLASHSILVDADTS
jgi:hypothetical protein